MHFKLIEIEILHILYHTPDNNEIKPAMVMKEDPNEVLKRLRAESKRKQEEKERQEEEIREKRRQAGFDSDDSDADV